MVVVRDEGCIGSPTTSNELIEIERSRGQTLALFPKDSIRPLKPESEKSIDSKIPELAVQDYLMPSIAIMTPA